jgi:hypothetical protein
MTTQHSLYWTTHASSNFHRYLPAGQDQVIKVVRTAVRKHAEGLDWHDGKKRVQGVRTHAVYELRSTSGHRVLVHPDESDLVIVDVGEHEVVRRYARASAADHQMWLKMKLPAPKFFQPTFAHPLLLETDEGVDSELPEELDSGWLSYLDKEQAAVTDRVCDTLALSRFNQDVATYAFLVHGGAGTGKTAILANLATRFAEMSIPVRLECSPAVRRYLRQYARIRSDLLDGALTNAWRRTAGGRSAIHRGRPLQRAACYRRRSDGGRRRV